MNVVAAVAAAASFRYPADFPAAQVEGTSPELSSFAAQQQALVKLLPAVQGSNGGRRCHWPSELKEVLASFLLAPSCLDGECGVLGPGGRRGRPAVPALLAQGLGAGPVGHVRVLVVCPEKSDRGEEKKG